MKWITRTPQRRVSCWMDSGAVIVREQEPIAWVNRTGPGRARWTDDRVSITRGELERIMGAVERMDAECKS